MNEQRTQAYLNLINQLLSCNDGDETRILQDNQGLLDQGLIEVMVAVAQQLGEAGRENDARWLMNVAQQLAEALGLLKDETIATTNTSEDYFNFLMETLQKVNENPNPQLLYPFWKQNLNKLNDNLILILDNWARETLTSVNSEQAYSIAADIGNFSNLIQQFPLSNIAANKEIAITGHEIALNIFTFDAFPQDWAMTQNNLANAYSNRIRGDKAENLEMAIAAYTEALKVRTFDAFPQQWAATQNNLANAYSNRIRGDKAENIKQAVMCYQNALQGYETAGDFLNAAEMGLTLGKVKVDRGEWYQGLAYLEKSLKIYRQFDDLKSRADTIYQIAHTHHLIGNHEKASIYYRDALRFYEYLKHDRGVAFCKASLGRLMLQIGFVEKAKELLKEATFIFKELNNEQEIAKIAEVLNCLAKIKEKQAV
jgi:tetratricopeptide (TPR) repeat protein